VCCFGGFVKYDCVRSVGVDSAISCGSVIVQLEFCDTDCGSYLYYGIGGFFDSPFDSQFLMDSAGYLTVTMGVIARTTKVIC
jgi:hypothetical protein